MTKVASISWQMAVAELTAERGRAVAAASVIKRLGNGTEIAKAELVYGTGKAEADAVISTFDIALGEGKGLDDLSDLESRMKLVAEAREAMGKQAMALTAAEDSTEKGLVFDLIGKFSPKLLEALGALYTNWRDGEASLRRTIMERLKDARWPDFAEIEIR